MKPERDIFHLTNWQCTYCYTCSGTADQVNELKRALVNAPVSWIVFHSLPHCKRSFSCLYVSAGAVSVCWSLKTPTCSPGTQYSSWYQVWHNASGYPSYSLRWNCSGTACLPYACAYAPEVGKACRRFSGNLPTGIEDHLPCADDCVCENSQSSMSSSVCRRILWDTCK